MGNTNSNTVPENLKKLEALYEKLERDKELYKEFIANEDKFLQDRGYNPVEVKELFQGITKERNNILKGLDKANDNDLIILSDSDEIPDLKKIGQIKPSTKFTAFSQKMFMYKLNLQNLKNGRQPTIEFRQHSSTTNYDKVSAWVRFCVRFCENAANLAPPTPFKRGRDVDSKFEALFCFVIKDRALRNFYKKRKDLLEYESDGPCCTDCSSGRGCSQWLIDA